VSVPGNSVQGVKQVVKVRVLPSERDAAALYETLQTCNLAASWLSAQMHAARVFRKIDAQHRFYNELRARFGLAAQPAIRVIGKVAEAYAALRANIAAGNYGPPGSDRRRRVEDSPIVFRPSGAQPFDARCLSWHFADELQAKKTSSARRLLKKRRRVETGFAADINHQISKCTVAEAERTGYGIAVEQLTGIRDRVRPRKPQRATLHSWAFAQLGSFLAYKAKQAGVALVEVDHAYTSQTCSACGWVDKHNRRTQAVFECGRCRFVGHADHNAAINISARGVERWGEVMRPYAAPTLAAS